MPAVLEDDEGLHLDALPEQRAGQEPKSVRGGRQSVVVVPGDHPAQRDAGAHVQRRQDGVKHGAADVFSTDVNAFRAGRRQLPGEIVAAAVDAGIEAQTFHGTFVAVNSKGDALVPLMNALERDATRSSCTALPLAK